MSEQRPPRPANPNLRSAALLAELVTNTLDPGYAAAAARRQGRPARRWWDAPAVAIGCALIGFTLVIAYVHTHRAAPTAKKVHDDLVARVRTAQSSAVALDRDAQRLSSQIAAQRDAALGSSGLTSTLDRAELLAGLTPVTGPGVQVVLADAPTAPATPGNNRPGTVPIGATQVLTDRDVRAVVNELWHDGAEAISVNDVRITASSAIRFAGQAVLVDFQPLTSPYTIRAIGDSDVLVTSFADSAVASRYHTLAAARGITFSFDQVDKLHLPASTATTLQYAVPIETATPSTGPTR